MKKFLEILLSSKKLVALIVTMVALALTRFLGLEEAQAQELGREIVALAGAYLVGQGIADHGKGKEEKRAEAEVAVKEAELKVVEARAKRAEARSSGRLPRQLG